MVEMQRSASLRMHSLWSVLLRSRAFVASLAFLLACGPAVARATIYVFTIDPIQSFLEVNTTVSGMRFSVPGPFEDLFVATAPQSGPGITGGTLPGGTPTNGTRGPLSGQVTVELRPTQATFVTSASLVQIGSVGTFAPGRAASRLTPAPANLAVSFDDALFGIDGDLALRNGKFSLFGQNIPLTPSTPGSVTFSPSFALTPFWMDGVYDSEINGVTGSIAATNVQPFASNTGQGRFEQLAGGRMRLTLPFVLQNQPFGFPIVGVPLPADLEVRVTGQLVATAPEAGSALPAIAVLLVLALRRRGGRALGRGVVLSLAALLLISSGCADAGDAAFANAERANQADASVDLENGAFTDTDTNSAAPDAAAAASVEGEVGGFVVVYNSEVERVERPSLPNEIWAFQASVTATHDGSVPISFSYTGGLSGSFNYSLQIPAGEGTPTEVYVTFLDVVTGGAVSDVRSVKAEVSCDGGAPTALVANDTTPVPATPSPPGGSTVTGLCLYALEHSGSRTNVATEEFQATAQVYPRQAFFQLTASDCAELDPENPFMRTDGSCGNGIGTPCRHSSHCAAGYYCPNTICVDGADGDACDIDSQCNTGLTCINRQCHAPSAECDPVAQTGCAAQEACGVVFGAEGAQTRCGAPGEVAEAGACLLGASPSTSCQPGLACDVSVCREMCHDASDCDSGEACDVVGLSAILAIGDDSAEPTGVCRATANCFGCR
jgi:hypothetical protein